MTGPRILLIVGGGIAAYKACELVRLIRKGEGAVNCVLTEGGAKFVTPLALAALSENPVHTTLWDLKNEVEMGHIQLSRQADLVVVCPATADLLAKMAAGIADDLATTLLLATDKPVLVVPAMNVRMWQHAATVRNVEALRASGVVVVEPDEGAMACGEFGPGRLPEPYAVWQQMALMLGFDAGIAEVPAPGFALWDGAGEEAPESEDSGLGGLSASLVMRSGAPLPPPDPEAGDLLPEGLPPVDVPEVEFAPGGPLLARKGKARSAPPTDAEAINHLVSPHGDAAAPEPFPEEMPPQVEVAPGALAEPLEGQPDSRMIPRIARSMASTS